MQRDQVEHGLERVVGAAHFGFQEGSTVVPGGQLFAGASEPVGLVVHDEEAITTGATARPENEVKAPGQVTPEVGGQVRPRQVGPIPGQALPRPDVRGEERGHVTQQNLTDRVVPAGQGELEDELVEAVSASEVAQPSAAGQTAQRGGDGGLEASGQEERVACAPHRRSRRCSFSMASRRSERRSTAEKSTFSSTLWTNVPNVAPAGADERREATASRS